MYNLNRLEETEVGTDDRPVFPPKILSMQVLFSPFDDITPRASASQSAAAREKEAAAAASALAANRGARATRCVVGYWDVAGALHALGLVRPVDNSDFFFFHQRSPALTFRNTTLLSFGDEAEAEVEAVGNARMRIRSSHDVLTDDPRLSREAAVDPDELARSFANQAQSRRAEQRKEDLKLQVAAGRSGDGIASDSKPPGSTPGIASANRTDKGDSKAVARRVADDDNDDDDDDDDEEAGGDRHRADERYNAKMREQVEQKRAAAAGTTAPTKKSGGQGAVPAAPAPAGPRSVQEEIASVKRELLRYKQGDRQNDAKQQEVDAVEQSKFLSPLEAQRLKYTKNRKRQEQQDRESEV